MESKRVSNNMLLRMPAYLNYVKGLPQTTKNISATKIANALGLGEVLVRKDLAKVSDGGRCKLGYPCDELIDDIETFLDVKTTIDAVAVGQGDLLRILMIYEGFGTSGLNILAGFDIGSYERQECNGKMIYPIRDLGDFCESRKIPVGIILATTENAQKSCDHLVSNGIEAIWNFSSVHLNVPENVVVQNENLIASVTKLRMQIKERDTILE